MRNDCGSWLASNPPMIAPVAHPASRNPSPRGPACRMSFARATSTTLALTTPAIITEMRDAQRAHQRLFLEVREAFLHVRINGEGKAGFRDFRIFAGFERLGGCL